MISCKLVSQRTGSPRRSTPSESKDMGVRAAGPSVCLCSGQKALGWCYPTTSSPWQGHSSPPSLERATHPFTPGEPNPGPRKGPHKDPYFQGVDQYFRKEVKKQKAAASLRPGSYCCSPCHLTHKYVAKGSPSLATSLRPPGASTVTVRRGV